MKITGLELIPVFSTREMGRSSPSDPNKSISYHVIVRLHTDAGVVGLGEMSDIDFASDAPVERLQRKLEPLLLGKDPFARGSIAIDLESRTWDHQVVCGIDIAVHDAVAKALDVPLHVLFGGKLRDRIPFSYPLARCQTDADVDANVERVEWLQGLGHDMVRYYFGADIDLDYRLLTEIRRRGVKINALDAADGSKSATPYRLSTGSRSSSRTSWSRLSAGGTMRPSRTSWPSRTPSTSPSGSISPAPRLRSAWRGTTR